MRRLLQHWTESSIIPSSKERSIWRKWKPKKRTVSFVEDRSLTWSTSTSGSLEPTIPSRIMPTYLLLLIEMMIFRNSIRNETEFYYQWRKSHLMIGRIVQTKNTRVWETQDRIGIVQHGDYQKKAGPDYHRLKTMVKRSIEQNLRNEEFWSQKWKFWHKRCGQESGDKTAWTKNSRRLLAMES